MATGAEAAMGRPRRLRVLVVGQVPPPVTGQSVALASFVGGAYERLELRQVPMTFSADTAEIGQFRLRKVLKLPLLVGRILWARLRWRPEVLYYPPTAARAVPFLRDVAVLLLCRWAFRATVLHLHTEGMSDAYGRLGPIGRRLFRAAYGHPDLVISPSASTHAGVLGARRQVVVPNGVPDDAAPLLRSRPAKTGEPRLLFVGTLSESKGVLTLLEAFGRLQAGGTSCRLRLVGRFQPAAFEHEVRRVLDEHRLAGTVDLLGELTGAEKWAEFLRADVFCLPSRFDNLPLAVIEAMEFALPVVATRVGGVEGLVVDGTTGYLVEAGDAAMLKERIARLLADPVLRREMGEQGRRRYLERYTVGRYRKEMEAAMALVGRP